MKKKKVHEHCGKKMRGVFLGQKFAEKSAGQPPMMPGKVAGPRKIFLGGYRGPRGTFLGMVPGKKCGAAFDHPWQKGMAA